jgi:hypothetical protein
LDFFKLKLPLELKLPLIALTGDQQHEWLLALLDNKPCGLLTR